MKIKHFDRTDYHPWSWYAGRDTDLQCVLDPLGDSGKNETINERTKRNILAVWQPKGDEMVLDFGCGVGRLSEWIAPQVRAVLAIDTCKEMIDRAKKNTKNFNVLYKTTRLDLVDGKYDVIFDIGVSVFFSEELKAGIAEEFKRLLKPDGKLIYLPL